MRTLSHLSAVCLLLLFSRLAFGDTTIEDPEDDTTIELSQGMQPWGFIDAAEVESNQTITVKIFLMATGESTFTKVYDFTVNTEPTSPSGYVWAAPSAYSNPGAFAGGVWWVRLESDVSGPLANSMGTIAPTGD